MGHADADGIATHLWALSSIECVDHLSDPKRRFEVFAAVEKASSERPELPHGQILKVAARPDDAGRLAVWHPDFDELMVCQPTLWGLVIFGEIREPADLEKLEGTGLGPRWVYTSRGTIIQSPGSPRA